jgi:hypothetical protein
MIEQAIRQAVDEFGGAVFPKLNWSSPRVSYSCLQRMVNYIGVVYVGCCLDCDNSVLEMHFTF